MDESGYDFCEERNHKSYKAGKDENAHYGSHPDIKHRIDSNCLYEPYLIELGKRIKNFTISDLYVLQLWHLVG